MSTIAEEHTKYLRKSLDVLCGIFPPADTGQTLTVSAINAWSEIPASMQKVQDKARPIKHFDTIYSTLPENTKYGIVSSGVAGSTGYVASEVGVAITSNIDGYVTVYADYGRRFVLSVEANEPRYFYSNYAGREGNRAQIEHVIAGIAWVFDNDTIISCDLNLRGIETKAYKPSLQVSEMEMQAYYDYDLYSASRNYTIPQNSVVWYMAGYEEDMTQPRILYATESVKDNSNYRLSIKAQDMTKFLDVKMQANYIGSGDSWGFLGRFYNGPTQFDNYIRQYLFVDTPAYPYQQYLGRTCGQVAEEIVEGGWTSDVTRRQFIATICNLLEKPSIVCGDTFSMKYVDAGIPRYTWEYENDIKVALTNADITNFESNIDEASSHGIATHKGKTAGTIEIMHIDSLGAGEEALITTDVWADNYRTNKGTIIQDGYKWATHYKLLNNTASTLTNISITATLHEPYDNATQVANNSSDPAGELSIYWAQANDESGTITSYLPEFQLVRSPETIKFTWRGNPHLQPRDYFTYGGSTWTIDTVSLNHKEGGLTSEIYARKVIYGQ